MNSGDSGKPARTHMVFGARSVTSGLSPEAFSTPVSRRSPSAAASGPLRCSAVAICAAVFPRAPHSAICSAAAMLAGENTVFCAPAPSDR